MIDYTKVQFDIQSYDVKAKAWVYTKRNKADTADTQRLDGAPRRKIWPNGSYNMISVADTFKAIECGLKQEDCAYANKDIDSKTMLFIQQNADLVKSLVNK
jgi:hypothetical protein